VQRKNPKAPRKAPQQARSEATVAILLEATARVLTAGGIASVTTTRVAEEAGVSVGTLYQYFPTRDALVAAWEERMWESVLDEFIGRVNAALPVGDDVPQVVHALALVGVELIIDRARVYRFGAGDASQMAQSAARTALLERASAFLADVFEPLRESLNPPDLRRAAQLVVRTVTAIAFFGAAENQEGIAGGDLQRDLAAMIARYLLKDPRAIGQRAG
jgi:AcrR family transcriptional regulator